MSQLILVRHAKSAWNATGQWTGWTDVPLSEEGRVQAAETAEQLRGLSFDRAYTSDLKRCSDTLAIILATLGKKSVPVVVAPEIKERDYGHFTGKNKWQIKEEVGEEQFQRIRRGWEEPIPQGETLKDVYERAVPYFQKEILPQLVAGDTVLVVSSGNALRALVKFLEHISDDKIADVEIGVGEAYVYDINDRGEVTGKEIRADNAERGKL